LSDFQKFVIRGNMVDLAIGFTVGAAFSTVAKSLVEDIIMPPISALLGSADFSDLFLVLRAGETPPPYPTRAIAKEAGAVTLNYGQFASNITSLLVVALAMYLLIKTFNRFEARLRKTAE